MQKLTEKQCSLEKVGPIALPQTGYYGWRGEGGNTAHYVLCDAAPIGPDYQPGHAHADFFTFELSLGGHRVVTDTGVFDYQRSPERSYCRSTAAHNTVEIAGKDACEMWGAFRVGRRGRPHDVTYEPSADGFRLAGWHDGYRHLAGGCVAHREFTWQNSGVLAVRDTVTSHRPTPCVTRLHLAPDCRMVVAEDGRVDVSYPKGKCSIYWALGPTGRLAVSESEAYFEMGTRVTRPCLEMTWEATRGPTGFCIANLPLKSFDLERGAVVGINEEIVGW